MLWVWLRALIRFCVHVDRHVGSLAWTHELDLHRVGNAFLLALCPQVFHGTQQLRGCLVRRRPRCPEPATIGMISVREDSADPILLLSLGHTNGADVIPLGALFQTRKRGPCR